MLTAAALLLSKKLCLKHYLYVLHDAPEWKNVTVPSLSGKMIAYVLWLPLSFGCDAVIPVFSDCLVSFVWVWDWRCLSAVAFSV